MEQRIIEVAEKYKNLAGMLKSMDAGEELGGSMPAEVASPLVRLYYAKKFEEELKKCSVLLEEESDEETVGAVEDAMDAVNAAADDAFEAAEEYAAHNREFSDMIEGISVSSGVDGLSGYLYKLFKCESIIREAYRGASRLPLYGIYSTYKGDTQPQSDFDVVMNEEDYIKQMLGIDMYELLNIRQELVDDISGILNKENLKDNV